MSKTDAIPMDKEIQSFQFIFTGQQYPESYYAFEDIIVWLRLIVMFMVLRSCIDSADANLWWEKQLGDNLNCSTITDANEERLLWEV